MFSTACVHAGVVAAFALCLTAGASSQQPAPARVVAVGDIHGDYAAFNGILQAAKLIDASGVWTGGDAVLVQTGDYTDRGPDVKRVIELLRALESSAPRARGRVHVLLGNHEVMNMLVEHRDLNPEVYKPFVDQNSESRRERAFADYLKLGDRREKESGVRAPVYDQRARETWMAAHPPGFLEYVAEFGPDGALGRWLRDKLVAVEVQGSIFMHAGLDPATAPPTLDELNRLVRDEIRKYDRARKYLADKGLILPFFTLKEAVAAAAAEGEALKQGKGVAADAQHVEMLNALLGLGTSPLLSGTGPMWFRGFANWTEEEGAASIGTLLERYRASRFVTGHTTQKANEIVARFDNRVFLIDTGMLAAVYKGNASALEIAGDTISAIYPDRKVVITNGAGQRAGRAPVR
jgi:hypothetical protein